MFDSFKKYITGKATFTEKELERIESFSVEKKLRKKQYLLQEGEIDKFLTFIVKGCLRSYRVSSNGDEHILDFAIENWWIGDFESFITGLPSKSNVDALEDSELLIWTAANFNLLVGEIPSLKLFFEKAYQRRLAAVNNRIYDAISSTAEDKYIDFIKKYPDIFNRVPLHMIASYLGLSRKTLSRIRSQLANK